MEVASEGHKPEELRTRWVAFPTLNGCDSGDNRSGTIETLVTEPGRELGRRSCKSQENFDQSENFELREHDQRERENLENTNHDFGAL
ncbi:hypothetical protein CsSME_00024891 [Camellia sinensis var. sinensis]